MSSERRVIYSGGFYASLPNGTDERVRKFFNENLLGGIDYTVITKIIFTVNAVGGINEDGWEIPDVLKFYNEESLNLFMLMFGDLYSLE